jgi:hypothetical protein
MSLGAGSIACTHLAGAPLLGLVLLHIAPGLICILLIIYHSCMS